MYRQERKLRYLIKYLIKEMASSVHQNYFDDIIDPNIKSPLDPNLQKNIMKKEKWGRDVNARLNRYKNVHVYVYPWSTNYNFVQDVETFMIDKFEEFKADGESFISHNGGTPRTIYSTPDSLKMCLDFLREMNLRNFNKLNPETLQQVEKNYQKIEEISDKIRSEADRSCALISVGSSSIAYRKNIRDLNTGWMAIHKLFDSPDFIEFLNSKYNITLKPFGKNELEMAGRNISLKIAAFNNKYKPRQGKNRNQFSFVGPFPALVQQPYNLKFQDKTKKGSEYSNIIIDPKNREKLFSNDPETRKNPLTQFARRNYLNAVDGKDPTEDEIINTPLAPDEYATTRSIQDFLPEMITYALGWFIEKQGDDYIVWDWDEDYKKGQTKRMTPKEVTLRFFQKDAYDLSSPADNEFIEKELMPFFEGVVLNFVMKIWDYFKGKIIINFM
jgi:hypothetical protein